MPAQLTVLALTERDAIGIPHELVRNLGALGREGKAAMDQCLQQRAVGMGQAVPDRLVHAWISPAAAGPLGGG